jgi:ABC-2 type transport system ATP-binding protein
VLRVTELTKRYRGRPAVSEVTFAIGAGRILGLLGPNGAGKTTILRTVAGLTRPDGGSIEVDGDLAFAPQDVGLCPPLSVRQNIAIFGELAGVGRGRALGAAVDRVAEELGVTGLLDRRVRSLSAGERRKVHVAGALVARPPLLLLDEPTTSLDTPSRAALLDVVRDRAKGGAAVCYSTNHLEEAERLADEVAFLDAGTVVAAGSVGELTAGHLPARPEAPSALEAVFASVTGRRYREDGAA